MSDSKPVFKINQAVLRLPGVRLATRDSDKVRGYFGNVFKETSSLFHNHDGQGGYVYDYSKIQYKVIDGVPTVVGVREAADLIMQAAHTVNQLIIADVTIPIGEKELTCQEQEYGMSDTLRRYRFTSPYFALNQKNYRTYTALTATERPAFLDKLVRSHLIAFYVGINQGVKPEQTIMCSTSLRPRTVMRDGRKMMMFLGEIVSNVIVPPLLGIGKSTSVGFGVLEAV